MSLINKEHQWRRESVDFEAVGGGDGEVKMGEFELVRFDKKRPSEFVQIIIIIQLV